MSMLLSTSTICLALQINIDKAAGGLRDAILSAFFHWPLFCQDENGPMENTPTLRDTCVDPFMARCINPCMQTPSKSQKRGAAVNRRRRLQFATVLYRKNIVSKKIGERPGKGWKGLGKVLGKAPRIFFPYNIVAGCANTRGAPYLADRPVVDGF